MSRPTGAVSEEQTPNASTVLWTIVARELSTAVVRKTYAALWIGTVLVVLFVAWSGGGLSAGYVSTIVDLRTPLELLIPILGMAFGYRAISSDERRGELDVLETYPVSAWQIVLGVYVGRAIGLVFVVSTALLSVMFGVFVTESYHPLFYATHTGVDSPGLYLRFVVLTLLFALVFLAIAVAISTLVSTTRTVVAAIGLGLFVLLFGLDILLVFGLARDVISHSSLAQSLAFSPLSAYRGLVFETTVTVTVGTGPRTADPVASFLGLVGWLAGTLAIATRSVRR